MENNDITPQTDNEINSKLYKDYNSLQIVSK